MRQNTYFVIYCVEKGTGVEHHYHMTTTISVDDPSAISKDIYNRAREHYEKSGSSNRPDGFYVESISLIDSHAVRPELPLECGIQFSSDTDLLFEGRKYLVRYDGHETHYCIGIYRDGALMEIDNEIEIRWGSTKPLFWAGPLP